MSRGLGIFCREKRLSHPGKEEGEVGHAEAGTARLVLGFSSPRTLQQSPRVAVSYAGSSREWKFNRKMETSFTAPQGKARAGQPGGGTVPWKGDFGTKRSQGEGRKGNKEPSRDCGSHCWALRDPHGTGKRGSSRDTGREMLTAPLRAEHHATANA